jgi:3-hydroxybutyryl-CoA dehydrogenase
MTHDDVGTTLPGRVGIYGGGRMGAGIAHGFALAGTDVVIMESGDDQARAARERVEGFLVKSRERVDPELDVGAVLSRVAVTSSIGELAGTDLVIEAVPEDPALKIDVLRRAAEAAPEAWLATNTSSLSIDSIAEGLPRPEGFIGLHFFNPVPASALVEVVVGRQTDQTLTGLATRWVEALGKTAITVRDAPGFASSRLGVAIALEAMRMVEDGVASAADIDTAMELGYRHPMGPLRTTDVVGLDVRLAIAEHLAAEVGSRFEPPQILRRLVAEGRLGRKSGGGFYDW